MNNLADNIATAIRAQQPLPAFPEGLSISDGYKLQSEVAALVSPDGFAGIKAGVTSEPLQAVFGIDHALLGRLYRRGQLQTGATLDHLDKQLIECEIGIVLNAAGQPVSACLAIEFAFAAFSSPSDATAANLVAGNVAADRFLTGELHPWQASFEGVVVKLYRDNELINEAPITESLGGPAQAVTWITREAEKFDLKITDNTLLMTGACGKVVPALPGTYRADCGKLGEVTFLIKPAESA